VLIDWFTVFAQIVNFLILVALLKYFLYGRIIMAMNKREERIRASLKEAEEERKKAKNEAETYRRKNEELEEQRRGILEKARKEADDKIKELTRQGREEVDRTRARWQESVEKEKRTFLQSLERLAVKEVHALSRKALKDLADADLEERIVEVFISRLMTLKNKDRDALRDAMLEEGKAVIRTGFELSSGSRRKITVAVREGTSEKIEMIYDTDPQLILGIEVKARGRKLGWSARDYLAELEDRAKAAVARGISEPGSSGTIEEGNIGQESRRGDAEKKNPSENLKPDKSDG